MTNFDLESKDDILFAPKVAHKLGPFINSRIGVSFLAQFASKIRKFTVSLGGHPGLQTID